MKRIILLALSWLLLSLNLTYANSRLQLRNIAFKEGLNNMNVSAIAQDRLGYIWVATMGGLSRYNGYEFKHYYFDAGNPSSLRSNHVSSLFCASDEKLYIGTETGLDCYDSRTDKLISISPDFKNVILSFAEKDGIIYVGTNAGLYRLRSGSQEPEKIEVGADTETLLFNSLLFDKNGNLWCGLGNGRGLAVYNINLNRFDFYQNRHAAHLTDINSVKTIFRYDENNLLLGTKGGLSCFDLAHRKFVELPGTSQLFAGLAGVDIRFILEKEPSVYWIGTLESGLFIWDKAHNTINRRCQHDGSGELHSSNYMTCLTDKSGNVWLGTFDAGLDVSFKQVKNFNYDISLNKITQGKFVTSISMDHDQNLIIATRENGFIVYNKSQKTCSTFDKTNSHLGQSNIRSIFADSENKYWIGIYFGLQIFDPRLKTFKTLSLPQPNNGAVSIMQMNDRVFVGTEGQGLLVFDLKGNLLEQNLLHGPTIPKIIQLNEKELLFTSYGYGVFVMNFSDYAIKKIEVADVDKYPGLLNAVTAFIDRERVIWIGTYNYGLFRLDRKQSRVQNFNVREGMPSTDAIGIEEDKENNLWISTSFGLAKLDKESLSIKTYFVNEGINNYQFHENACFKEESGTIWFGGNSGLTYFNPAVILQDNSEAPHIVLDALTVQNLPVTPSPDGILSQSLPYTQSITLSHKEQHFSIDFASFDFLSPEKMKYSYMLEGYDRDWFNIGKQRRVSFSNLPRGNYVFKVKAVNGAGISSENTASLRIKVKPAPWFTHLAWLIYFVLISVITFVIFKLKIKAYVYKKDLEIEHSEHLREREINVMKQKFFTNISHELRTPLTLIYGLVSQLSRLEQLNPQVKEFAQSLDMNVGRLLKLINQLLTYKKIESETLFLWLENLNVNEAIQKTVELFNLYAKEKDIRIDFLENNSFTFYFDYDKLEKILSNLLSNAIKHTKKGGRIEVILMKISTENARMLYDSDHALQSPEYIEISVSDMGAGIEEKDWSSIFERYKQVGSEGRMRPDYSGTGIGLNFTKTLVEMNKGAIRMESKPGLGSVFTFILPYDSSVYEPKDFADPGISSVNKSEAQNAVMVQETAVSKDLAIAPDFEKTVLVIEDDPQLNKFLLNSLKDYYKTIVAYEGDAGLKMVKQEYPDIVVSDVMMPGKDGYELTKCIKGSRDICHIPVILLTAKGETASQIEGMHAGADLYITKPFSIDYLLAAIDNQLRNRSRIHDIFLMGHMPALDKTVINHLDIQFISKLNAFLEKEMSNPELDILLLAQHMNMSKSGFYRKFMGLTKISPIAYIKKYRINKSIELMNLGKYTHMEISEMTGFGSASYFSTTFKQEKGMSPREYLNQSKEGSVTH